MVFAEESLANKQKGNCSIMRKLEPLLVFSKILGSECNRNQLNEGSIEKL